MQPLQYDLRSPAAKDNSITFAAKAGSNLAIPFTLREGYYSCKSQWNSIGNSSASNTCNPIYIEGTILELQITMEFHRQLIHQHSKPMAQGSEKTRRSHHWLPEPKMLRLDRAVSMVSETSEAYHQVFKGGILSTAHARNTGETPFTMRNRSEHDPTMIRA